MASNYKKTWGKSTLKFCPIKKKVWQLKYDANKSKHSVVIYNDMPSYGLEKVAIPEEYIKKIV